MTDELADFPEPIRYSLDLKDGRRLAYYVFPAKEPDTAYPILYMHGFPGSGVGGSICAKEVAIGGGQLFSFDRPGVGYTDPLPKAEYSFEACCKDVWEMIEIMKWKRFSLLGVSGGGPHALALVASYLERRQQQPTTAVLEKVVVVGSICCSAGAEGMMPIYQRLHTIVSDYHNSCWLRSQLRVMSFGTYIMFRFLPGSLMGKTLPARDKQMLKENRAYVKLMVSKARTALRQGSAGTTGESLRCFSSNSDWERILQKFYGSAELLPIIHIFHGGQDRIVPLSHALYMHEKLFAQQSKLHIFDDLGHVSLATDQMKSYVNQLMTFAHG